MKIFCFYLFLLSFCSGYFKIDIKLINRKFSCDPKCIFNFPEISSKSIEFFPKCDTICGLLNFNSNTDLKEDQLEIVFLNMKTLYGGIRIENSKLENLSFFGSDLNIDCSYYGICIANNPNLTDITKITNFNFSNHEKSECSVIIENNKMLSMDTVDGSLCDSGSLATVIDIKTFGNLKNCDSPETGTIFGGLTISYSEKIPSKIAQIRGPIVIENTDLEDLGFLGNLRDHKFFSNGGTVSLDIRDNLNLKRLGFSNTTKFQNISPHPSLANFENLHPDFCVTTEEMSLFLEAKFDCNSFHGKFCTDPEPENVCIFKNLKTLKKNCTRILGDLVIESGDEIHVEKLEEITHLFGGLFLRGTVLKDTNFLAKLQYIAYLEPSLPVIVIEGNKKLESILFPNMKHVITNGEKYGLLHDNMHSSHTLDFVNFSGDYWCDGSKIPIIGMKYYKECENIVDGLILRDTVFEDDIYKTKSIHYVNGKVEISNTNLRNASFLENVWVFQMDDTSLKKGEIFINVHHNPNMTSLGWKNIWEIYLPGSDSTMNFEKLHPEFCISIQEMVKFLTSSVKIRYLDAKLCDFNPRDFVEIICRFESMQKLRKGCDYLIGDVLIESGDEKYVEKLGIISIIFGSITIQNTKLVNLDFFDSLWAMTNFNDKIPISIVNNTNLKEVTKFLPYVVSKTSNTIIFDSNHPELFNSTKDCMAFQHFSSTNVTYNGGNCRMIDGVASGSGSIIFPWISILFHCINLYSKNLCSL